MTSSNRKTADFWLATQHEWTRRTTAVRPAELAALTGAAAAVGAILLLSGVDLYYIMSLGVSAVCGFIVCQALMARPALASSVHRWLAKWFGLSDSAADGRSRDNAMVSLTTAGGFRLQPWAAIRLSRRLNDALTKFLEALVDQYVNSWYKTDISVDDSFVLEVRHQIRYAAAVIAARLHDVDLIGLCLDELLPAVVMHAERVARLICSNERFGDTSLAAEARVLDAYDGDLHWALSAGDGAERDYLRALADILVAHCVDATKIGGRAVDADLRFSAGQAPSVGGSGGGNFRLWWPSHSCRHFLRELLLYTVLIPALDFVSDPDMLNRLVLSVLDDSDRLDRPPAIEETAISDEPTVEFLSRLTDDVSRRQAPDSLLSLKLNDLVREPRLIQLFDMYLRDIQGPTHMLDCFLQARDIHKRLQALGADPPSEERERQATLNEIKSDAWQLFSAFVHDSAPNCIDFPAVVREDFGAATAVTGQDVHQLEHATEDVYKELYRRLHYDYVIPFCQSENYLGYLCGAPPEVEELIRPAVDGYDGKGEARDGVVAGGSRPSTPSSTFSLTQFRNKLFSVLGGGGAVRGVPLDGKDGVLTAGEPVDDSEMGEIALVDLSRDLSKWTVAISSVVCRREVVSSKTYFVYAIEVCRHDLSAVDESADLEQRTFMNWTQSLPANFRAVGTSLMRRATDEAANLLPPMTGGVDEVHVNFELDEAADDEEEEGNDDILPTTWTTYRKYDEFFQLEEKIREFHGNSLRTAGLPDRKAFLSGRNRSLMEAHKTLLERFLQSLTQQPILRRSELLYDFLTLTEEEWSANMAALAGTGAGTNFMPDLRNPLRAMRRMPTKLTRERGQNLKPFILGILANILVPRSAVYTSSTSTGGKYATTPAFSKKSGTSSLSMTQSGGGGGASSRASTASCQQFPGVGDVSLSARIEAKSGSSNGHIKNDGAEIINVMNADALVADIAKNVVSEPSSPRPSSASVDCISEPIQFSTLEQYFRRTGLGGLLTFIVLRIFHASRWLEAMLVSVLRLVQPLARLAASRLCAERVLCEDNLLNALDALSRVLFDASRDPVHFISDEERRLRADVTLHRLEEVVRQRWAAATPPLLRVIAPLGGGHAALRAVFAAFQLPRLNRQLAFVLVDRIVSQFTANNGATEALN